MPRTIWKGAVSFGLVHIPVALVPATTRSGIDFDWLDKRSMDRVGYKRINKTTGEDIESENIVKGVEYEKGNYVVISDDEIKAAHPEATQTVDIVAFVDAKDISFLYIATPYYLTPDRRGEKGLRAAARNPDSDWQGRHRQRGAAQQAASGRGDAAGQSTGDEYAALGR